jgi:RNA polymerase sigma-70 factor (ECF subfamily)
MSVASLTDRRDQPQESVPTLALLYEAHFEFVWRTLRRFGVPALEVDDATQEAFLVVHKKLNEISQVTNIRGWLFEVARRVAASWRSRAQVRREEPGLDGVPERTTSQDTATEGIARRQARAMLGAALDELDEDKRAVFVLFELEQLPMHEVAQTVGCPLQTAYARLYAARKVIEVWVEQRAQEFVS